MESLIAMKLARRIGWLVSKPQGSACLCLSSTGIWDHKRTTQHPAFFFLVVWIQKIGLKSSCLQRKPFICWAISPSFILVHFYVTGPKDVWSEVGVSVSHTCPLETKRAWHQSGKCCLVETHCIYLYATSLFWQFSSMPKNRKASLIDSYTPIT